MFSYLLNYDYKTYIFYHKENVSQQLATDILL